MKEKIGSLLYFVPVIVVILLFGSMAFGSGGAVTIEEHTSQLVKRIVFAWVSDATGDVEPASTTIAVSGKIIGFAAEPGLTSASPEDGYDITLKDRYGFDVLRGSGLNLPQSATAVIVAETFIPLMNDKLNLSVLNAGATRSGTAYLFYQ